jgi:hypothetical protein
MELLKPAANRETVGRPDPPAAQLAGFVVQRLIRQ